MASAQQSFDAFISYSHAADGRLAPALAAAVARVNTPWYARAGLRVFVDQAVLTADPSLWATIENHLQRSRWLVFLASPLSASSPWVGRELAWWLEHRGLERLVIVLTEGDILWDASAGAFDPVATTALPPLLLESRYAEEPLYIDLRGVRRDELTRRHAGFHKASVDIGALLLDRPREEIDGVEVRQSRLARRLVIGAVSAFALLLAFGGERAWRAVLQSHVAQSRQLANAAAAVDDPVLALLLSAHAVRKAPTSEATRALAEQLIRSSALERSFWGHTAGVTGLALSPRGDLALSAGADGRVQAWSVRDSDPVGRRTVATYEGPVVGLALSADGGLLASANENQLRIDTLRGTGPARVAATDGAARPLGFSADGLHLVTAQPKHHVGLWSVVPRLELQDAWPGHQQEIRAVRFSRNGELTTLDAGGDLITWSARGQQILQHTLRMPVSAAAASTDVPAFAVGGCAVPHFICTEGSVFAWDYATWSAVLEGVAVLTQQPQAAAWSADGRWIAAGGCARTYWSDQGLRRCERGGLVLRSAADRPAFRGGQELESHTLLAHSGAVRQVAFAADGSVVATGAEDGAVMLWRLLGGQPMSRRMKGVRGSEPRRLRFIGSQRLIVEDCVRRFPVDSPVCQQRDLALLDLQSGDWKWLSLGHEGPEPIAFDLVDEGRLLVTHVCSGNDSEGPCHRWRKIAVTLAESGAAPRTLSERAEAAPPPGLAGAVAVAPGIWSASASGMMAGARCRRDASPPTRAASGMVPAKPERCEQTEIVTAVAGSDGSRARLLWATVDEASAIALSPDGLMVAMGAADGTVQAWDIRAGAFRLLPVGAHTGEVLDLAFDDAGRRLASSGVDGTIRIWDLAYDDPLRLACRKAGRNLSRGEWRRHVGDEFEYEETCPGLPSPLRPDWSINEAVEAPYLRGRGGDTPKAFAW